MGKWAEVPCACANRIPVEGSDPDFDRPHRRKHRLSKRQQQEVEDWKRTTENMYRCGHRNGMAIELWPGDIIELSRCVAESFDAWIHREIFAKVGDFRSYEGELLRLTSQEARNWLAGLTFLQERCSGRAGFDQDPLSKVLTCVLMKEAASQANMGIAFKGVEGTFAAVGRLRPGAAESQPPTFEAAQNKIAEALRDAIKLCRASMNTGTPLSFHW